MSVLEVRDLVVRYGDVTAVDQVSLSVGPGRVVAILGRNGAGKSTLLQATAGLVRPASGTIAWDGQDLARTPADRRSRLGISLVAEGRRIFPDLTVRENLRLGGFHLPTDRFETAVARVNRLFPVLSERSEQLAGRLSGGQQQMLSIGRALIGDPRLVLLDEPSLGLAPKIARDVYARLAELRDHDIGLVIVEQQVERVLELADEVLVLRLGEVALASPADAIDREDPRLRDAYLGEGAA
ncbi:MAG: ABC transporter ATP-binding protein [Nitriliruptorales bacterium]